MKLPTDKDFAYGMTPLKIVSWPLGTWPLQEYNFTTGVRSVVTLILLLLMMLILHMEIYLDHGNAEKNLDAVLIMACGMLAISKVASFRFRPAGLIANFVSAVRDYQELNDQETRAIVKRHAHMARVASVNILFFSYFSATLFMLVPLFAGEEDNVENFNQTRKFRLNYPMPSDSTMELLQVSGNMYVIVYIGEFLLLVLLAAGNLGFQFILSLHVHNLVMLMKTFIVVNTLLTQMFAYSYVGEYSKNQFGGIGHLIYCSDWYNAPCNLSKNILFVLMKTQTPVHLKAGRFFVINIETYMSILRTSMSYLSVLRVMITE
ncbi:uncharacterized protein LOC143216153 [Lasioglossum baleicum]|uniref:uncharacterized protein LOC143216153 n=1 Tax=Lasioglossum baleicum TaxID=434251 RepID=UPI003FCC861C